MTNFEKIMQDTTIESLAAGKALNNYCNGELHKCSKYHNRYMLSYACFRCWIDWLKQEIKEDKE